MTEKQQWAYSNYEDGDDWTLVDSREDAISEGNAECSSDLFFIAPAKFIQIADVVYVNVDSILENIVDQCDYMPETCEGWLRGISKGAKEDLKARLENALCHWMAKYKLGPTWFEIGNTECIEASDDLRLEPFTFGENE